MFLASDDDLRVKGDDSLFTIALTLSAKPAEDERLKKRVDPIFISFKNEKNELDETEKIDATY